MSSTLDTRPMSRHAERIARDHCLAPERVDAPIYGGRYRSLFPDLPALEADEAAVHALGRAVGPCDLGIDFPDRPTVASRRCGRSSVSSWPTTSPLTARL